MDGVGQVAADGGVERDDRLGLFAYVGEDGGSGGAGCSGRGAGALGGAVVLRGRLREGPGQFGGGAGGADAGLPQALLDGVEDTGVGVVGGLDLDLGPGGPASSGEAPGVDGVDGEFGEEVAVGVEEAADVTGGAEADDGHDLAAADAGAQEAARSGGRVSESGALISSRTPTATGNFRCQPASDPPVRRRRVIESAARRRSGVSW